MSKPTAGKYFIVNRVNSVTGKSLALNYDGDNAVVTVTELQSLPTQVWNIVDYTDGRTQSVSPKIASNLQIGMGNGVLKTLPACDYVWTIRKSEDVYTIQDGNLTVFWGLRAAMAEEPVSFGRGIGSEKQSWLLIPA